VLDDDRTALVAVGMNGVPLPVEHGFPARLLVAGLYGYVSATKWLSEIEVTRFDRFDQYWVPRGYAAKAPIKTFSRIDTPKPLTNTPAGTVAIAGVAWAQTRGIDRVEVRIDDGPWQASELSPAPNNETWRQWMLPAELASGRHTITCRATDGTGETQTEARVRPLPDGATGWHSVVVLVA
jgi:DMSO/TMAO reductase YedYZ molybdopterin-dependent catalytic subunit